MLFRSAGHLMDHDLVAVPAGNILQDQHGVGQLGRLAKLKCEVACGEHRRELFHAGQSFHAALRLTSLGAAGPVPPLDGDADRELQWAKLRTFSEMVSEDSPPKS